MVTNKDIRVFGECGYRCTEVIVVIENGDTGLGLQQSLVALLRAESHTAFLRDCVLQWMSANTKATTGRTVRRARDFRALSPTWDVFIKLLPNWLGELCKERLEDC